MAWMSICGFYSSLPPNDTTQSLSYNTTVSAALRLIPNPPDRVVRRNTGIEASPQKEAMAVSRSSRVEHPAIQQ